jgi:DMSO/TMAO reductase YedYZ molybdopterin-dependent catalytic subunit
MSAKFDPGRRRFLTTTAAASSALLLGGCDGEISDQAWVHDTLRSAESLTYRAQRALVTRPAMAREFTEADLSPAFRANGNTEVDTDEYRAHLAAGFVNWRLKIGGLVDKPAEYSLEELRAMPSRTQITRHDCVEGWSCIGKWKGVPLGHLLEQAGVKPEGRFVHFKCADSFGESADGSDQYYETVDMDDAFHAQTILAYDMNDAPLTQAHGAPIRARIERQLGYKMPKYVMQVDVIESFAALGRGRGGFWPDRGYAWYGGI